MITPSFEHFLLLSIALRSLALLVITLGVTFLVRRRSAAVIHRIWTLGFCGCIVIPIVTVLSPGWALPILPSPTSTVSTSNSSGDTFPAVTAVTRKDSSYEPIRAQPVPVQATMGPLSQEHPANREPTTYRNGNVAQSSLQWPSVATWALIVWCAGTVVVVLRLAQQHLAMRSALGDCENLEGESWCISRDTVTRQLRLGVKVVLKRHPNAASPMVVGILRPVVLLPHDAERWSPERLKMVLLHETAHIQRRDILTQTIAGLACAIHWFNPLAWWGATQMKRLRELACDDLVVTHTTRPSQYAQTLLDVAQNYQAKQPSCGVAMARNSNVVGRIGAILDSSRRRTSLTKRSAAIITVAAFVLSTFLGSLQLSSRADDPSSTANGNEGSGAQADESRTMVVRVLDESGTPLSDVTIHVSVWEFDGANKFPNRNYTTDREGEAEVLLPHQIKILRIWSSKEGYVPQFVNFASGKHEDGRLIPNTYRFQLQPGTRLSGVVTDIDGKPIADARVQVRVEVREPSWSVNPTPMISTWLASSEDAAITDESGRWEILNAPARKEQGSDFEFELQVTHPDFAGDTRWGELQEQQGITTSELRDGTAVLTMDRGIAITGSITDPDGKPVTKGLVIWDDSPYGATGVNETQIEASGRYETERLAPGDYPVTVVAPGFSPTQKTVSVSKSLQDVDFQLEPGHRVKLEIVDQSGNPIPEAYVQIGEWRGTEAIYNHKHSNVPESGIPRRADSDGIYEWTWAPADGVQYRVSSKGHDVRVVTVVASDQAHRVELAPVMTIFGNVVDSQAGTPVQQFRVFPVKAFRPDFYSTNFQKPVEGKDGDYEIQIHSHGQVDNRYRVRIEAEGYRTALGEKSLAVGDPPLYENFKLERSPALVGTVIGPAGERVNEFTVAVGTPTVPTHFDLERPDTSFGKSFQIQGESRFELPATFEPRRIRVFNDSGFAEILRQPDEQLGTIELRAWASVSGRVTQNGKPIPNEWVYFNPLVQRELTEARFQDSFSVKTDPNGYFKFERLPPMAGRVRAHLGPWRESSLTSSRSIPLNLKPGDQREVSLGGDGMEITGHVVATGRDNESLSKNWSLNYLISREVGVDYPADAPTLSFDAFGPLKTAWLRQPGFQTWLATRENHFVKLTDDGSLQIHGVSPGTYDLVIQLYEQPAGCLVETIGEKVVPIEVTKDDAVNGVLDIGSIEVPCRVGPRPGSDMRVFKFVDDTGRVRNVADMDGRYVLLHVWASWCQPCLDSMPSLKSAVRQRENDPLTVVGLNVDRDAEKARKMASIGGWNWAQNYLGSESDMMKQLAVSSVPAYYLIGPDGKLVASANTWTEIQERIDAEL